LCAPSRFTFAPLRAEPTLFPARPRCGFLAVRVAIFASLFSMI
jgi:hypothetical protein